MNSSRAVKIAGLVVLFALLPAVLNGAAQQLPATSEAPAASPAQADDPGSAQRRQLQQQQLPAPSEGQALHILVGKSVVVNVQTPITRVLSSNPAVIETLATSRTEVVVEGRSRWHQQSDSVGRDRALADAGRDRRP